MDACSIRMHVYVFTLGTNPSILIYLIHDKNIKLNQHHGRFHTVVSPCGDHRWPCIAIWWCYDMEILGFSSKPVKMPSPSTVRKISFGSISTSWILRDQFRTLGILRDHSGLLWTNVFSCIMFSFGRGCLQWGVRWWTHWDIFISPRSLCFSLARYTRVEDCQSFGKQAEDFSSFPYFPLFSFSGYYYVLFDNH